jgi:hypothetical protein
MFLIILKLLLNIYHAKIYLHIKFLFYIFFIYFNIINQLTSHKDTNQYINPSWSPAAFELSQQELDYLDAHKGQSGLGNSRFFEHENEENQLSAREQKNSTQ